MISNRDRDWYDARTINFLIRLALYGEFNRATSEICVSVHARSKRFHTRMESEKKKKKKREETQFTREQRKQ